MREHHLAEDLGRHLEVLVVVVVLEEALRVQSVPAHNILETHDHVVNALALPLARVLAPILRVLVRVAQHDVHAPLQVLLREHCVHRVNELPPADVVAGLLVASREGLAEQLEFGI